MTGRGVEATIDGSRYAVGGPALLRELDVEIADELRPRIEAWIGRGAAVLYLVEDDKVVGALALEDEIRPEAFAAVAALHELGRHVVMITGDADQVAESVGRTLGVDEVMAEVLPEDKAAKVAELQDRGLSVAMVGDGVNDAACARARRRRHRDRFRHRRRDRVGRRRPRSSDPRRVASVVRLSVASYRKMIENLTWAAGYNIVALPLAAGAFQWAGITLAPAVGAILMSVSTIVVALNAQLLRRVDLSPSEHA